MTEAEKRLLQDRAYAAYTRLNRAIETSGRNRQELLEEHRTMTRYVVTALEQDEPPAGKGETGPG